LPKSVAWAGDRKAMKILIRKVGNGFIAGDIDALCGARIFDSERIFKDWIELSDYLFQRLVQNKAPDGVELKE
jgi:hypothetical protein